MRRKYLDEIGCKDRWDEWEYEGEYVEELKKQREEWGFDERETFSLDGTFYEWLYERLRVYKEVGGKVVNLDYPRFEYEGKEYTQAELIDEMLKRLEFNFSEEYNDGNEAHYKYVHETEKIWAVVLPAMWW